MAYFRVWDASKVAFCAALAQFIELFVQNFAKNGLIVSSTKVCGLFDKGNDTSSGKEWCFFEEGINFL